MSILHDTLAKYIESKDGDPEVKAWALKTLEKEIIDEIVNQKANEITQALKDKKQEMLKAERQAEIARKIKEAGRAFWAVVVLGLTVGLLGNQLTEMITRVKEFFNSFWGVTLLCIAGFGFVVYMIFKHEYLGPAGEMIEKFVKESMKNDE